jgi:hypothetical protein
MPTLIIDAQTNAAQPRLRFADSMDSAPVDGRDSPRIRGRQERTDPTKSRTLHPQPWGTDAAATMRRQLDARRLEDVLKVQSRSAERSVGSFFECGTTLAKLGDGIGIASAIVGGWLRAKS